jgi:DNA-binding phage protein
MKLFNRVLRKYINTTGLPNVTAFANQVGVSSATMYNWLAMQRNPELETLMTLAFNLSKLTGQQYHDILTELVLSLPTPTQD